MSRRRVSLALRLIESLLQLNCLKINHLEAMTIHLIDDVAKRICSQCSKKKDSFNDCVVMQREYDIDFLKNRCTNCVVDNHKCFFVEVVEVIEDDVKKNL